jgi:manganese/zinc/iron transport system ATP- binding protein
MFVYQPLISVRNVTVVYRHEPAIEDVSLDVLPGDSIAIIGPNGAGKSTLLKAMLGLIQYQRGTIQIAGRRDRLGYVAQHEQVDWTFPVSVLDTVLMGMWRDIGWVRRPNRGHRDRALQALHRVGMGELANRQVGELSGGQRRRVFIARALAQQVDVLLLDEPFSGVDASAESELLDVLHRLNSEGITLLMSTHDLEQAREQFRTVLALRRHVIAYGKPQDVFTREHLSALYGQRVLAYDGDHQVHLYVDEHGCGDC